MHYLAPINNAEVHVLVQEGASGKFPLSGVLDFPLQYKINAIFIYWEFMVSTVFGTCFIFLKFIGNTVGTCILSWFSVNADVVVYVEFLSFLQSSLIPSPGPFSWSVYNLRFFFFPIIVMRLRDDFTFSSHHFI